MKEDSFVRFVLDQLGALEGLECRAMFGGHGIYLDENFFGILHDGRAYFRTRESTRPKYAEYGMSPFRPNERQTLRNYYEVPVDILEDRDALCEWACASAATAPARPG